MQSLLNNTRFYILLFTVFLSLGMYLWVTETISQGTLQTIRLAQLYALTAVGYLYITLLAGPFCYIFKSFPYIKQYLHARRALGVSVFYFASLHAFLVFFGQLGGFEGLGFLNNKYLLAISLSFTAYIILFLLTMTSFDFMIKKMTFIKWKLLHRLIYLAGILILLHALLLGTHFADISAFIPQTIFGAVLFLGMLEAMRFDVFLQKKFSHLPRFGITMTLVISVTFLWLFSFLNTPETNPVSFGIHSQHIEMAKKAAQQSKTNNNPNMLSSLQGDKTKRFTVSFLHPEIIEPNTNTQLTFQVYDAATGNKVKVFQQLYGKIVHLIIVDSELKYFNHIHPEQKDNGFSITTQFPKEGVYHVYADFQPLGAVEQQFAFTVSVGNAVDEQLSNAKPDTNLTKTFGQYEVTLSKPTPLRATEMSIGGQELMFTIKNADTKQPITNLKPYLEAFGHLVMINEKTFEYIHVHPADLRVPTPDENGGPTVAFMPLGLYKPIQPGTYRIFAQFNPNGELFTADYTIKIE